MDQSEEIVHIKSLDNIEYPGISKNFSWTDIKPFTVITGKNGSGKTKLLQYLHKEYVNKNDVQLTVRLIDARYQPPMNKYRNELTRQYQYLFTQKKTEHYFYEKNGTSIHLGKASLQPVIQSLDYQILDLLFKHSQAQDNNHTQHAEIRAKFRKYEENWDLKECLNGLADGLTEIDKIFIELELPIRIDRFDTSGEIKFCVRISEGDKNDEKAVYAEELSSGELLAFALSLWIWGSADGKKTQVLLIDEFDAHLNPCLMKTFVDMIKKTFVDKGVQVIMTTHSPSTVYYAAKCGADIAWMERGKKVKKKTSDIIYDLSSGMISDLRTEAEELIKLNLNDKYLVLTEGKTDPTHLRNAVYVLDYNDYFKDVKFFGCTGATTVELFATLPFGQKKTVLLFDNDTAWDTVKDSITKLCEKDKSKKFLLSHTDSESQLEDLFKPELLKHFRRLDSKNKFTGDKQSHATDMSKTDNKTIGNYENFKPLLDRILKSFDLPQPSPP
jgi:ABC-type cobalamin/Fe3+-siderophores transport system ATPase subunit